VLPLHHPDHRADHRGSAARALVLLAVFTVAPLAVEVPSPASAHIAASVVRTRMRTVMPRVRACYDRALATETSPLVGTIAVRLVIDGRGDVVDASIARSTLGRPALEACVLSAVGELKLPPIARAPITIVYPFRFEPGPAR
jgi:TonB family protein